MVYLRKWTLTHPDVADVLYAGSDGQTRMQGMWVAPRVSLAERTEENGVSGWDLEFHVVVFGKVRLAVCELVVQVHEQRPYPLSTSCLKLVANVRVFATSIVVRLVKPADLILDHLHILAAIDRFIGQTGRNHAEFSRDRIGFGYPRGLAHPDLLVDALVDVQHLARSEQLLRLDEIDQVLALAGSQSALDDPRWRPPTVG